MIGEGEHRDWSNAWFNTQKTGSIPGEQEVD